MKDNTLAEKITSYIEEHLEEELTLDMLAKTFHYTKFYINRQFCEKTGCTIHQYLKLRRLTEAARKLVETEKAITEIAFEAGYASQQAFTQAFRLVYACAPFEYRKQGIFRPVREHAEETNCLMRWAA